MKFEIGKMYKSRGGNKYKCIHLRTNCRFKGDYTVLLVCVYDDTTIYTSETGQYIGGILSSFDIVSEWQEPHPAESWEVDKPILVSDIGHSWVPRHFSEFKNGEIYAWVDGCTSHTTNNRMVWREAKPY